MRFPLTCLLPLLLATVASGPGLAAAEMPDRDRELTESEAEAEERRAEQAEERADAAQERAEEHSELAEERAERAKERSEERAEQAEERAEEQSERAEELAEERAERAEERAEEVENDAKAREHAVDNTGRNQRDREGKELTPIDQANDQQSLERVAAIRSRLLEAEQLSVNAHNLKVITVPGEVHLRGPLANEEEHQLVLRLVAEAAPGVLIVDRTEIVDQDPRRRDEQIRKKKTDQRR